MNSSHRMALPSGYADSRERFRVLGARLGGEPRCFYHDEEASGSPRLSTDTVYLGPARADTLVVIASGTHGVEGYAGAMCQLRLLEAYPARFADRGIACLLAHALNPWGYLHDSRVTPEGVDLNRNFVDFPVTDADPCGYGDYHALLVSRFRPLPGGLWNELRFLAYGLTRQRRRALQAAITAGQYTYPDGLFFGGAVPTRSRLVWEEIVRTYAHGRQRVFLLDLHTGLGRRGTGELISHLPPAHADFRRMSAWFGDTVRSAAGGQSVSAALAGTLTAAFGRAVAGTSYALGLEFGTRSPLVVLNALRADQWWRNHAARVTPRQRERVRRKMKAAFAVPDRAWAEQVAVRFDEVIGQLADALADE
ncbi:MAG TPA: DUF2817 domain-containing protein [Burkholderiaceae bacterium]|nr:DUF2817 domain-containing protein [Burkholderiaceae bacterium]